MTSTTQNGTAVGETLIERSLAELFCESLLFRREEGFVRSRLRWDDAPELIHSMNEKLILVSANPFPLLLVFIFLVWRGVFSCSQFFLLVASMTAKKLNWLPFSPFGYFFRCRKSWFNVLSLVPCMFGFLCSARWAPALIQSLRSPTHDMSVVIVNESGRGRAANRMFASKQKAGRAILWMNIKPPAFERRRESRVGGMKALIALNRERIFAQLLPSLHMFSRETVSWQRCTMSQVISINILQPFTSSFTRILCIKVWQNR